MAKRADKTYGYVHGTNALAYEYEESRTNAEKVNKEIVASSYKSGSNIAYTMGLIFVIILMLLTCLVMLKAQFAVSSTTEEVITLRKELRQIKQQNAHLEALYEENLDLVEIKRIAMEEYGMVYPTNRDIINLATEESSYTVQYMFVEPPTMKKASFSDVLAFITKGW